MQAGSSDHGRVFAARHAEAIFTAQQRIEDAQAFYRDVKSRAFDLGRNPPAHIKILPGLSPFIGGTEEEARRLEREFNDLTIPAFGLMQLKDFAYVDLDDLDLDAPVPIEAFGDAGDVTNNKKSRTQVYADIVRREKPTLRQLLHKLAGARGHRVVAGTPEQIADTMTDWFDNHAADASTSCRHTCRADSTCSPRPWSRSCVAAACSARATRARATRAPGPAAPGQTVGSRRRHRL